MIDQLHPHMKVELVIAIIVVAIALFIYSLFWDNRRS